MTKLLILAATVMLALGAVVFADETGKASIREKQATKATFLITGLHCPACTTTVASSLGSVKGIHTIKVDWKTKNARLEFDESVLTAQRVAQLIPATPHMMGGNLHYGGWLALKVPDLKDDATGKQVKEVLSKVEGVKQVVVYPAQHSVAIAFGPKGSLTTALLVDALSKAGIKAANL